MGNFLAGKSELVLGLGLWAALIPVALCQTEAAQQPETKKEAAAAANESKGMPPRASASDYQAQGHAGSVTIAADFDGHAVPTMDGLYSSEDYVVVEVALFGAVDGRIKLSIEDFSLQLKDRKTALTSQPFGYLTRSLKDPEWQPPEEEGGGGKKSKTGLNTGGGGGDSGPPIPPKMPLPLRRAMEQKVLKSVLPEGDRALPVAGLIFFQYRGKAQSLKDKDMQLVYNGPAGTVNLPLQP